MSCAARDQEDTSPAHIPVQAFDATRRSPAEVASRNTDHYFVRALALTLNIFTPRWYAVSCPLAGLRPWR
jgi:hypothetical protein